MQPVELAKYVVEYALEKKAEDPVVLDLRQLTTMTDFFVIVSGNTGRQVEAIAEGIVDALEEHHRIPLLHKEDDDDARWLLLDYGAVIVHVFRQDARDFYDLERLWADAKQVALG